MKIEVMLSLIPQSLSVGVRAARIARCDRSTKTEVRVSIVGGHLDRWNSAEKLAASEDDSRPSLNCGRLRC